MAMQLLIGQEEQKKRTITEKSAIKVKAEKQVGKDEKNVL